MNTQQLEETKPLFQPENHVMNVAVFGSGSGTNLKALLKAQKGGHFAVRALFTDRSCPMLEIGKQHNIPTIYHSFVRFFNERGEDNHQNRSLREEFDRDVLAALDGLGFSIDLIFLAGYMRLIHRPLLERYTVINLHPADLTALDDSGRRKYVGDRAIEKALVAGEKRTRSSIHLVTEELDGGPILFSGPWVSYTGRMPLNEARAEQHTERHKRLSEWPAVVKAVEWIGQGRVAIGANQKVYIDGVEMPASGYEM